MKASAKRPVYLNLLQIRQPIGAVVSILHRITGFVMTLLTIFALWALQTSLQGPAGFEQVKSMLSAGLGRVAMLFVLWLLIQHLYSGIRHLLIDVDVGVEISSARRSAWLTLAASILTVAVLGALF